MHEQAVPRPVERDLVGRAVDGHDAVDVVAAPSVVTKPPTARTIPTSTMTAGSANQAARGRRRRAAGGPYGGPAAAYAAGGAP